MFWISLRYLCYLLFDQLLTQFSSLKNLYLNELLPVNKYSLKVNNKDTRKRSEICSKLTIRKPERRHWPCSGFFIVNFEHISHLLLVLLLLNKVNVRYHLLRRRGLKSAFVLSSSVVLLALNIHFSSDYRKVEAPVVISAASLSKRQQKKLDNFSLNNRCTSSTEMLSAPIQM